MTFSKIRKHLSYANVAVTLTFLLAMSGGAYAASKIIITSTKQIKPSVLKQLEKGGPAGKQGPTGPVGPVGPVGVPGAKGENGAAGTDGKEGPAGTSVTSKELTKSDIACKKEGGTEFVAAEGKKSTACNGKEGSPWTAGGTLPKGSSERGQWVLSGTGGGYYRETSLSFPIPLAAGLHEANVHVIGVEEGFKEANESAVIVNGDCTGTWENPGAKSENLCVFLYPGVLGEPKLSVSDAESESFSAGPSGAILGESPGGESIFFYKGSWVVTG
jgi:hypothetical protein